LVVVLLFVADQFAAFWISTIFNAWLYQVVPSDCPRCCLLALRLIVCKRPSKEPLFTQFPKPFELFITSIESNCLAGNRTRTICECRLVIVAKFYWFK
jgi:hypothetical protein